MSTDPNCYPHSPEWMPLPHTPQAPPVSLPGTPIPLQGQKQTPPMSPGVLAPDAHPSYPTPSPHMPSSLCGISPSSDTVLYSTTPMNGRRLLNPNASSFTPKRIIIKSESRREIDLEPFRVKEPLAPYRPIPLSLPARSTVSVRIESDDARRKRMAEEERLLQEMENKAKRCKTTEVGAYEEDGEPTMREEAEKKAATAASAATKRLSSSQTKTNVISAPLSSVLATARMIEDIGTIVYPEGILSPKPELNRNTEPGKFRFVPLWRWLDSHYERN